MGRFLPAVIVRDFFASTICYAELNGRVRPRADVQMLLQRPIEEEFIYRVTMNPFREAYLRAAGAVAFIAVMDSEKEGESIGSAFHIGDGIFITARHVIEKLTIIEIATTKSVHLSEEAGGRVFPPQRFEIIDGPYFESSGLDVAVFRVDLGSVPLPAIKVSEHTDFSLGENDLMLRDVLIIGYPPIPFTIAPNQVATLGQINSVVRVLNTPTLHFIASAMARGGFSGGVALDQSGVVLGLVTQSLLKDEKTAPELGFMSILSIEPAVELAAEKFGFGTHVGSPCRYSDTLFGANFSKPSDRPLSSFIYDATIMVYDDDRDVFVEINCYDELLRAEVVEAFSEVTPLHGCQLEDGSVLFTPLNNPPAAVLISAAEAASALLIARGFRMLPAERSRWQLKWGS